MSASSFAAAPPQIQALPGANQKTMAACQADMLVIAARIIAALRAIDAYDSKKTRWEVGITREIVRSVLLVQIYF